MIKYERKLLKFWAQSFLLGVPTIIVGFRDQQGIVHRLEELDTASIPGKVKKVGRGTWDGNICINFAAGFMECKSQSIRHIIDWQGLLSSVLCWCGLGLGADSFFVFLQG
jgi:RAT1-interacting protein